MWYDMKILLGLRFSCQSFLNLFVANTIIHVLTNSSFAWSHYSTGTIFQTFEKGSALRGHVAERFSVLSLLECQLNCVRLLPKCKSFNYKEKRNNCNVCEINTSSKDFAHVQDFVKDGESIYGEVINPTKYITPYTTTYPANFSDINAACKSQNAASNITIRYKANTITYSQATSTCRDEGKNLCSENQICCDGENPFNGVLADDHWAPISVALTNGYKLENQFTRLVVFILNWDQNPNGGQLPVLMASRDICFVATLIR